MKKHHMSLLTLITASIFILGACGNADESNADSGEQQNHNESTSAANVTDEVPTEISPEAHGAENANEHSHVNPSKELADGEQQGELESKKDTYLKKLNEMEEEDRYAETTTTTEELIEQETQRYEKWDKELNIIYGQLKEQLSPVQMEQLKEEQREWIVMRDETAKESSLNYKGGSMESLEYVATQAELTRERCYLLVARYMN